MNEEESRREARELSIFECVLIEVSGGRGGCQYNLKGKRDLKLGGGRGSASLNDSRTRPPSGFRRQFEFVKNFIYRSNNGVRCGELEDFSRDCRGCDVSRRVRDAG